MRYALSSACSLSCKNLNAQRDWLHVLPIPARAVEGWLDLLRRHQVTGGAVFDLQIVATMLANDINRIYTFNGSDFDVFSELVVVTP
jgi:predicted nucleic acid-binding protein